MKLNVELPPTNPTVERVSEYYAEQKSLNSAVRIGRSAFHLYLSLIEARQSDIPGWRESETIVEDSDFPARLNHYRRSPLTVDTQNLNQYLTWQHALSHSLATPTIKLWQALHPDPLSFIDNPNKLPTEVKHNCSYKTQLRWLELSDPGQDTQVDNTNEPDPTLLADLIPPAQSYSAVI